MVQDETSRFGLNNLRTLLAVALDAATEETAITISIQNELPEAMIAAIILVDHLMWEKTGFLVPDQNFLGLEPSQFLDTLINIS